MRAFTLLESLIYIALFGIVMTGAITGFSALTEFSNRSQTQSLIDTEGMFLLSKITYDAQHSQKISIPNPTELDLVSDAGQTINYQSNTNVLDRTEGGIITPLSDATISVQNLQFTFQNVPATTSNSVGGVLRTSMLISATSGDGEFLSENLSSGSYFFP